MPENKAHLKQKTLSIQIRMDGFSFYISGDTPVENHIFFDPYDPCPKAVLENFKKGFQPQLLLQKKYDDIKIIHTNPWATIVPKEYFNAAIAREYLSKNITLFEQDFVSDDFCKSINAQVVYVPFVAVNNFLLDVYDCFDYFHETTLCLDILARINHFPKAFYVSFFHRHMYVYVFENAALKFYNCFDFETIPDAVYYLLSVFFEENAATEQTPLVLMGAARSNVFLYKSLQEYFKNIHFIDDLNLGFSNANISLSHH